jgi:competence protein ComEC
VTAGLQLLAGVLLALGSAALPGTAWLLAAGICVALVFATPLRSAACLRQLAWLLLGMLLAWNASRQWLALQVPVSIDARVLFEGRVLTVPAREGAELFFDVEGIIVEGAGPVDGRVRRARLAWRDVRFAPRAGEHWRLLLRLLPLADTRNFAAADPARFAFRDGVHLAGRVLPSTLNTRLTLAPTSIDTLRARIAVRIRDGIADPDAAALLTALAVGLTDGMSADQWRVFNATGTTHLVAISGLHVTMFALSALGLARFLWRWLPPARRLAREPFAWLLGLTAAGAYSLLAGFSVPTQRTWLMLAIVALARLTARHAGAARIFGVAVIAVLLLDARAPLSAGFWLSFVAVGVILAATEPSARHGGLLARASGVVRLQVAIMLTLTPLTLAVFDSVSIAGLWANLIVIPCMSFVLVPLVLAGVLTALVSPAFGDVFFVAAATLYEWAWPGLVWAADGDWALWRTTPPAWWFALAAAAGIVLLRRWPAALRWSGACAALPLLLAPTRMPDPGTARLSIFDAGRGAAVLIVTHSHALLFDTGDSWNTGGARLRQIVLPALDALGRASIDVLVLPALNEDRAKGAALLAFDRHVHRVHVGGGWPGTALPAVGCADSDFRWDGVRFQIFTSGTGRRFCVLRVSIGAHAVLLAGDLDRDAERALVSRLGAGGLASEVVLMSRQGSPLGSAPEWIEAVAAELAIVTGGIAQANSRGTTLQRWRQSGAAVLDTRRDGGIELALGTSGARVLAVASTARYPFVWRRLQ